MRIPRRISDILSRKQDYIDSQRDKLERTFIKLQSRLLDKLLAEVIPELETENGVIKASTKNFRILQDIDNIYSDFSDVFSSSVFAQVTSATGGISSMSQKYFSFVLTESLKNRLDKVVKATDRIMKMRLGINHMGKSVSGGFLDALTKDMSIATQLKNFTAKAVTGQIDAKNYIKGLSKIVTGEDSPGAYERQFRQYAFDLYQQYDRAYSTSIAKEFDMSFFIYQGGRVEDSRDFCVCHNNKVWSREETEDWANWTPSMGEYPEGYEIKQKDYYAVPSYLGYPGYQPLVDLGGYNCRHSIGWIPDELAFELRPELNVNNSKRK